MRPTLHMRPRALHARGGGNCAAIDTVVAVGNSWSTLLGIISTQSCRIIYLRHLQASTVLLPAYLNPFFFVSAFTRSSLGMAFLPLTAVILFARIAAAIPCASIYSYWNGCSTGGRQGLMEAQKYPTDYDGILADSPAINWPRFSVAEQWPQVVM
jgi:hypothetical protein